MKQKLTLIVEAASLPEDADLVPEDVGIAYPRIMALSPNDSTASAPHFAVIPISANARVNQMKWADWAQILSALSKCIEEPFPIAFRSM